jgi:hypothetical protein
VLGEGRDELVALGLEHAARNRDAFGDELLEATAVDVRVRIATPDDHALDLRAEDLLRAWRRTPEVMTYSTAPFAPSPAARSATTSA